MNKFKHLLVTSLIVSLLLATVTGCQKVITYPEDVYSVIYSDIIIGGSSDDELGDLENEGYDEDDSFLNDTEDTTANPSNGILVDDVYFDEEDFKDEDEEAEKLGVAITGGKAFYVKDFGAKGDGKTDDGYAINRAINIAENYTKKNSGKKAEVRFEKNKTYVLKTGDPTAPNSSCLISIYQANNITLVGNNATIIGLPDKGYLLVQLSANIHVKGLNFNYDTPVAYKATVVKVDGVKTTFSVPKWFADCARKNPNYPELDGVPMAYALQANGLRGQVTCKTATAIDDSHVEITLAGMPKVGTEWYIPTPGYSHNGIAFQTLHNQGVVTYEDINIWNASQFIFQVNGNFGKLNWINVKLEPKDENSCETVAWRDVVHAKDNRQSLNFDRCVFKGTHDDIFNIANTLAQITEMGEENDIKIVGLDYANGGFAKIQEGDTAVILNPDEGILYGQAKVVEVISQTTNNIRIRLDKSFELDGSEYIYFKEMASPGTTITNCELDGTFRIRAKSTIENCSLNVLAMWTHYSGLTSEVEGPIPENIIYRNCTFTHPAGQTNVFNFNCETKSGAIADFTVKNILFDSCTFEDNMMIEAQKGVEIRNPIYKTIK
ncbi:MAG: hypothetical protein IKK24_03215 [Clostridia bacterium]|nr:hypothetical protein [Clostridia bacterium]